MEIKRAIFIYRAMHITLVTTICSACLATTPQHHVAKNGGCEPTSVKFIALFIYLQAESKLQRNAGAKGVGQEHRQGVSRGPRLLARGLGRAAPERKHRWARGWQPLAPGCRGRGGP